jgi:hypothetical protein
MKLVKFFGFLLAFFVLACLTVKVVFGQTELPRITVACEAKNGVLSAPNNQQQCNNQATLVLLGAAPAPQNGGQGSTYIGIGNLAFIYGNQILTNDGQTWYYGGEGEVFPDQPGDPTPMWRVDRIVATVPPELMAKVVQWQGSWLIDKDGNIWSFNYGTNAWENLGSPESSQ